MVTSTAIFLMEISTKGGLVTVEVMPIGTRCTLACEMCFQNPIRAAGNQSNGLYNLEAMKKGLAAENYHFTLFGGEPLLTPIDDLEELWRWGFEKYGSNGVQTSASCITEKHFELFKKYNVSVGISLEGPGELNDIRWAGSLERTRETTKQVEAVLHRLLAEGRPPSLITILNRGNANHERLPKLLEWFRDLGARGLRHVNLHLMEVDDPKLRRRWTLTDEENAVALLACGELGSELDVCFQPIADMTALLLGTDSKTNCTWNACDPYTTRAVRGISAHGDRVNCSRSNKAGVDMQKADAELLVRPIALYHTAQASGGCEGCRFWFACKGSCPGEALERDWRKKTEHCEALKLIFSELEARLSNVGLKPISRDDGRRKAIEAALLASYQAGRGIRIHETIKASGSSSRAHTDTAHGDGGHGDHNDAEKPVITHGDSDAPHGDAPHGDGPHGDHNDAERPIVTHGDSSSPEPHGDGPHTDKWSGELTTKVFTGGKL